MEQDTGFLPEAENVLCEGRGGGGGHGDRGGSLSGAAMIGRDIGAGIAVGITVIAQKEVDVFGFGADRELDVGGLACAEIGDLGFVAGLHGDGFMDGGRAVVRAASDERDGCDE